MIQELYTWAFILEKLKPFNVCSHKNVDMNVHSNFICNNHKPKTPRCPSTGEWLNCGTTIPWNFIQQ